MAWNGTEIITAALQYLDDDGTALGDVRGGELSINPNVQIEGAIGGQSSVQGGIIEANLTVDLLEPVKAYITGMPRATAATQSTNYDFECGTTDGSYNLSLMQPAGFTYEVQPLTNNIPRCELRYAIARVAEASTGSAQAASAGMADCGTDFDVTIDTTDYRCRRAAVTLATGPQPVRSVDTKATGYKRWPDAYILAGQGDRWSCSLDLEKKLPVASSSLLADTVDADIDIVIAGTSITFTLSSLVTPTEVMPFESGDGIVLYRYEFQSLPGFGLCQCG